MTSILCIISYLFSKLIAILGNHVLVLIVAFSQFVPGVLDDNYQSFIWIKQ